MEARPQMATSVLERHATYAKSMHQHVLEGTLIVIEPYLTEIVFINSPIPITVLTKFSLFTFTTNTLLVLATFIISSAVEGNTQKHIGKGRNKKMHKQECRI